MLCNKCGSLDHWEKNCTRTNSIDSAIAVGPMVYVGCSECNKKDLEISRLKAKYEMSAEDQLERIRTQNREAQKRYRNKRKSEEVKN